MSQPLHLTHAEARAKMEQVESGLHDIYAKKQSMESDAQAMLAADWRGDSASAFGNRMEAHAQELQGIYNDLNAMVDVARSNMDATYQLG